MGGVDYSDKSIYHHTCSRLTRRYWKTIFMILLDISLLNAYILYKKNTDKPLCRGNFIMSIVEELVKDTSGTPLQPNNGRIYSWSIWRFTNSLQRLPGTKEHLCAECHEADKKSKSRYWCPRCNCGVHTACFYLLKHYFKNMKGGKKRKHEYVRDECD